MAIYYLSTKPISRAKGKSATAAAAYRSGSKIYDERLGLTFNYTSKKGVFHSEILTPDDAPDWAFDREQLWNKVEQHEHRINARTAKEFIIALPIELSHQQRHDLVRKWVQEEFISGGVVADIAYHDFDSNNPHVHIMTTTRTIDQKGFKKKLRDWDKVERLLALRKSWSEAANAALEAAGSNERIDHRNLKEQGEDRIPQIHLGANVAAMMEKGIQTDRGDLYLSIEAANQALLEQKQHLEELNQLIAETEQANSKAREVIKTALIILKDEGIKENNYLTHVSNNYFIQATSNKLIIGRSQYNKVLLNYKDNNIIENNLSEEDFKRFDNVAKAIKNQRKAEQDLER